MESLDYPDLVARAMEELRLKTAAHDQLWHLSEAAWNVDQDAGEIIFTTPNGVTATCSVQIIGTFNTEDSTWLWAWDHPSVVAPLREHANRLREYGQTSGIDELTTRKLSVTEDKCWQFAALACMLNEAQGAYRGPADPAMVFMTFGEPSLSQDDISPEDALASLLNDRAPEDESGPASEVLPSKFISEIPDDVQAVLVVFIAALRDWEIEAHQLNTAAKSDEKLEVLNTIRENYHALIREWCSEDVTPQPVAFGGNPNHDPENESLISAAVVGDECYVRTQHPGFSGFVSDYEYHLRFEDGRWRVRQLFFVDGDEKYEML